jgi:hypothetical protein
MGRVSVRAARMIEPHESWQAELATRLLNLN